MGLIRIVTDRIGQKEKPAINKGRATTFLEARRNDAGTIKNKLVVPDTEERGKKGQEGTPLTY